MSTNKLFWRTWLEGRQHKETNTVSTADPLEEGLRDLNWADEEVVRKVKTEESFGEETLI